MGLCINVLGIPLLEDKACAEARRESKNERKAISQAGRTARSTAKSSTGQSDTVGSFFDSIESTAQIAGTTASSIFGGGSSSGGTDLSALALPLTVGAIAVGVGLAMSSGRK